MDYQRVLPLAGQVEEPAMTCAMGEKKDMRHTQRALRKH
jgi:hypothetical protein